MSGCLCRNQPRSLRTPDYNGLLCQNLTQAAKPSHCTAQSPDQGGPALVQRGIAALPHARRRHNEGSPLRAPERLRMEPQVRNIHPTESVQPGRNARLRRPIAGPVNLVGPHQTNKLMFRTRDLGRHATPRPGTALSCLAPGHGRNPRPRRNTVGATPSTRPRNDEGARAKSWRETPCALRALVRLEADIDPAGRRPASPGDRGCRALGRARPGRGSAPRASSKPIRHTSC